jgi:nitroreductase
LLVLFFGFVLTFFCVTQSTSSLQPRQFCELGGIYRLRWRQKSELTSVSTLRYSIMSHADSVLELLKARVSVPTLTAPAPDGQILREICQCALRAPDHAMLRPWRYLIIEGEALDRLGRLFQQANLADDPATSEVALQRAQSKPKRAPMIIVGISTNQPNDKVTVLEQQLSCGIGMGYLLLALQAKGFGGIWRTGAMVRHPVVKAGLGIADHETLLGFLYVGTPTSGYKAAPELVVEDYFSRWG